jgi:hypothetical protein
LPKDFYFHLTQEGCERLAQNVEGVPPYFTTSVDIEMFPDHLVWDRFENGYTESKGYLTNDSFLFESKALWHQFFKSAISRR